jgi:hypothetical protein
MSKHVSERRLVDVILQHARQQHKAAREVPHYEKRIDIVVLRCDTDELWAIEAKMADWAAALSQAIVNLTAAHRSYIAVYAANAHRVNAGLLADQGIGLISVGAKWGEVSILQSAPPSPYVNACALARVKARVTMGA